MKRIRQFTLIGVLFLLTACAVISAPELDLAGGSQEASNHHSRLARFLQAVLPRVLEWSDSQNPLSTMCASGYVTKEVGTITGCASENGIYTSATLIVGGAVPSTNTGLLEVHCYDDSYYQGFQAANPITFEISVNPSSKEVTISVTAGGYLYALTSDWNYMTTGIFTFPFSGSFPFKKTSSDSDYTLNCSSSSDPYYIDNEQSLFACSYLETYLTQSCQSIH